MRGLCCLRGLLLSSRSGLPGVHSFCTEQLPGQVASATGGEIGLASGAPEIVYKRKVKEHNFFGAWLCIPAMMLWFRMNADP